MALGAANPGQENPEMCDDFSSYSTLYVHDSFTVSSEANARAVFEDLFGLARVKSFHANEELVKGLFGMEGEAEVIVYDAGPTQLEVFVCPRTAGRGEQYDHACMAVKDRPALMDKARSMGMTVFSFFKGDRELIFIQDLDGNRYEIKEQD